MPTSKTLLMLCKQEICVAVVEFKEIKTGDTLTGEKHKAMLEALTFLEPVMGYSVEPKKQGDQDKLSISISKL